MSRTRDKSWGRAKTSKVVQNAVIMALVVLSIVYVSTHSHAPDPVTALTQREVLGLQTRGHRRP